MRRGILSCVATCVAVVALLLSGCSGGDDDADVSAGYGIGPIEISVNSKGEVKVEVGAKFTTPVGTFSVKGGITEGLEQDADETVVLIRQTVKGKAQDTAFSIKTNQKLIVDQNGKSRQEITTRRVLIEVKPGTALRVRIEPSPSPTPTGTSTRKPAYRLAYRDKLLTVPNPDLNGTQGIDLDIPVVSENANLSSYDVDLDWTDSHGLSGRGGVLFGSAPSRQRNPAKCAEFAREQPVGNAESEELAKGHAFCVVTDEEAVASIEVAYKSGGDPEQASLTFRVSLWKLTTALFPPADYTGYDELFTKEIALPNPEVNGHQVADLDEPRAGRAGDIDSDLADVYWSDGRGFRALDGRLIGTAPPKRPKPNVCADHARERAIGSVAPERLEVRQTYCVITDVGNVAYLRLTGMSGDEPEEARLTFSVTLWGQRL